MAICVPEIKGAKINDFSLEHYLSKPFLIDIFDTTNLEKYVYIRRNN
jgi:hypothetical protein